MPTIIKFKHFCANCSYIWDILENYFHISKPYFLHKYFQLLLISKDSFGGVKFQTIHNITVQIPIFFLRWGERIFLKWQMVFMKLNALNPHSSKFHQEFNFKNSTSQRTILPHWTNCNITDKAQQEACAHITEENKWWTMLSKTDR